MRSIRYALSLICFVAVSGGASPDASAGPTRVPMGTWRGVLEVPGGQLPFNFVLSHSDSVYSAFLINGEERVAIEEVRVGENHLTLFLTTFNSRITAVLDGEMLRGSLRLTKRAGRFQMIPMRAWPDSEWRFFSEEQLVEVDVSGRWGVTFRDDDGNEMNAVGEFRQERDRLFGTFLTPTGDYRYLEGDVRRRNIYLSCFDGAHAFLFKGRVLLDGTLEGDFWSGTAWHETFVAKMDDEAALPDPTRLTFLKEGYERLEFSFPDEDGNEVSLSDERFENKVVVVSLEGTWCPNCHDEAAFLSEYYDKMDSDDLEIVLLMYEHMQEFNEAAIQVKRFRERYQIGYQTLIAGVSDKRAAAETLPMLNHILAFPTTIIIDKQGKVRRIYTGFNGPGTGEHFEEFKREFESVIRGLIYE